MVSNFYDKSLFRNAVFCYSMILSKKTLIGSTASDKVIHPWSDPGPTSLSQRRKEKRSNIFFSPQILLLVVGKPLRPHALKVTFWVLTALTLT